MNKSVQLIIVLSFFAQTLFAQNDSIVNMYVSMIDSVFSEIDTADISTGLLIERSIPMLEINNFNGSDTSVACDTYSWLQIYKQLYLAHFNLSEFNFSDTLENKYPKKVLEYETIEIGMIFYDYNKFHHDALNNGLIELDSINNKILDLSGSNESPFDTSTCFAIAPFSIEIEAGTYNFYINPNLIVSNITDSFDEIYIDFHQGRGYETVTVGSTMVVSYSTPGEKIISMKVVVQDKTYYPEGSIDVNQSGGGGSVIRPDFGPELFTAAGIVAEYGIYYRCSVSMDKKNSKTLCYCFWF